MNLYPFRRKNDISPVDTLDDCLNAWTSGLDMTTTQPDGDSLSGAAHAFHAWADDAQQGDPDAKGPADDLWNRILDRQRTSSLPRGGQSPVHPPLVGGFGNDVDTPGRRTSDMNTAINTSIERLAAPQSNRTRKPNEYPRTRSGGWFSAVAAALLILSLGGGLFLAENGGFGFGDGDEGGRYSVQVVSPEASPTGESAVCNVEPLTTDQIMAYVENPYSYMPVGYYETIGPEPATPAPDISEGLFETEPVWPELVDDSDTRLPSQEEFDAALAVAETYYACMVNGTVAQAWSLMNPVVVQHAVLGMFPTYRDRDEIVSYVDSVRDLVLNDAYYADDSPDGQRVYPNFSLQDARVLVNGAEAYLYDADMVMFIGEEVRLPDETIVGVVGWDAQPPDGGERTPADGTSIMLVHSQAADRWFVHGAIDPAQVE